MGVAVWDGRKGDGNGGTASTLDRWKADELDIEVIPLDRILVSAGMAAPERTEEPPVESTADGAAPNFVPDILGLLFADAVGFSKLREDEVPGFVRHFLGIVGELADRSEHQPLFRNTWGDGIYMVFQHAAGAGSFALELSRLIDRTDWHAKGLRDLKLRIGVHAGPVYRCMDPVTHAHNYMGAHVSRAARIEPITPPGHVYASQAFAALASVARGTGFTSEYVGQIGMAKHYGVFPTYVLREARESGCALTARKPRFSCQID
jgi:class 3 adenylate cyclase